MRFECRTGERRETNYLSCLMPTLRFLLGLQLVFFSAFLYAEKRPNVLLVMVDDMGWSDLRCYGGEIDTPNVDLLATGGLRFTRFYNNSVCGPTRASLLTGLYCQQTGHRGNHWNQPKDFSKCVLIPELLQDGGYHTAMVGKWQGRDLAVKRGFNRFFGPNCQGKISYWHPVVSNDFYLDDKPWKFTDDFFMTDAFNDHAVTFLKEAVTGTKPFFLYVGYVAPHWPLHAREKTIARYRERYRKKGWNGWRATRLERQQQMGLLPDGAKPAPYPGNVPDWEKDKHKDWQAERMAVYAAQIANVDRGVGRMLEVLKKSGQLDDTLILFLSDNGAAPDGGFGPSNSGFGFSSTSPKNNWRRDKATIRPGSGPKVMPGPHDTFSGYGLAWALTSNTPLRSTKLSSYEGGIRTPLIAHWPKVIKKGNGLTRQPGHVIDVMATCLDLADLKYPTEFRKRRPLPMEGKSLVPILRGEKRSGHEALAWANPRGRALIMVDWKIIRPTDKLPWELYDLSSDPGETANLAKRHPNRVEDMADRYETWRERVGAR
jgi:arylsulfatase A-like enzyme